MTHYEPDSERRACPCCDGKGCSECDETGDRVATFMDLGDGATMRVHGSAVLSPEDREALAALGRAAYERFAAPVHREEGEG